METYSQAHQDIFVLTLLKNPGYFIDFGCNHPIIINNTYLLEKNGWQGLLIDMDAECIGLCKQQRSSTALCINLNSIDLKSLFEEHNVPKVIDYISLDVDDSTTHVLNHFPYNEYRFKIMTFEHDAYRRGDTLRGPSRQIFNHHGYQLVCGDIKNNGNSYEDWYVDPKYFNQSEILKYSFDSIEHTEIFKNDTTL